MIGLCAGMMLARDGHQVTLLEADATNPPTAPIDAWECWRRKGVAQFRQPHNLFARFRLICDQELPGLTERLLAAGCVWVDYLDPSSLPPTLTDIKPRPEDATLRFVTGRRPVVEASVTAMASEQPNLEIRRGVRVDGLLAGSASMPGVPHVSGVRTTAGEDIRADLVVDAMGRGSPARAWLSRLGALEPIEEREDITFTYYTRYFTGPQRPRRIGRPLAHVGSLSILTLDGDNDTWSVTLFAWSNDRAMKPLRDPACFDRVVAAFPLQAHWLDGKPITDVLVMGGYLDRYRRFVRDNQPVVSGFAAVGDAWACTNPSAGRGLSVGLLHAQVLRDVVRQHLDAPAALARAFDATTERDVTPFYRNQIEADRTRIEEMTALLEGTPMPISSTPMVRLMAAAAHDPEAFRGFVETVLCVAFPQDVMARPHIARKMDEFAEHQLPPVPGPDREQLLRLLEA